MTAQCGSMVSSSVGSTKNCKSREEERMAKTPHSRREILKSAAALTAVASFGAAVGRAAAPQPHPQIDAVLRQAAEAKEGSGVVAIAATDKGIFYEAPVGP